MSGPRNPRSGSLLADEDPCDSGGPPGSFSFNVPLPCQRNSFSGSRYWDTDFFVRWGAIILPTAQYVTSIFKLS